MRINGPTTQIVKPSDVDPVSKHQSSVVFGRWNSGLTGFLGTLGLRTQAVLNAHQPVTEESNASLATSLPQQYSGSRGR